MNARKAFAYLLSSNRSEIFLLALSHRIAIEARAPLAEPGEGAISRARACNEVLITLIAYLLERQEEVQDGYDPADLLSILVEKARMGNAEEELRQAIESTLLYMRTTLGMRLEGP